VIPLTFAWTDATGAFVDSAAAAPSVSIDPLSCASLAPSSEPITPDDAGDSNGLRYDAEARTWIYNWSTRPLAAGCYGPGECGPPRVCRTGVRVYRGAAEQVSAHLTLT
jgi:hypothetical protein